MKKAATPLIILRDTILNVEDSFKYLGIHFYKNGHWNRTQKILAQYASFALHNLFIVFNQIELTSIDKCKLFDSLVGSILNYSAEVWGHYESKDVELIHCKFLRKVLNVKKSTNLDGLYGELGRYPLSVSRKIIMIKYWIKIMQTNNPILLNIYALLKNDADNNITYNGMNWAHHVKSIFDKIGMSYVWNNQLNNNTPNVKLIIQRILDIYKQSWYTNINNSNKLDYYSKYKHSFVHEKYINCIFDNKFRISLTKFRLSSHDLAIETGRYTNIPRDQRICLQCNMNMVESEYHFLLVCPKY